MGHQGDMPNQLTHCTAVVLIPPADLWEPIQFIRREHDPQIGRWMPHVTLLYPFLPEAELSRAADVLRPLCAERAPFAVTLGEFRWFTHGGRSATLWLATEPSGPLMALHSSLLSAFPQCDHTARFAGGFTPHLSVGRWPAGRAGESAASLQAGWTPLGWPVDCISLIARPPRGLSPFVVQDELPLGRAGD
jgi:2'-5' RNA ligase